MAKLNIDIGVNLGTAIRDLGTLKMAFDGVSASLDNYISKVNTLKTSLGQIKSTSVNLNVNQTGGAVSAPKMAPVPDVFAEYRNGTSKAATVSEFLKNKQEELERYIRRLQKVANNTTDLKTYEEAQRRIAAATQQLQQVQANAAKGFSQISRTTGQANIVLTNFGRIAQDSAYGVLGISNNINPLVESWSQLNAEAKKTPGSSVWKELGKSLAGPGGLALAFSGVTAALSFAAVGLSYWTGKTKEAKEANNELKIMEEQLRAQIDATNKTIEKRTEFTDYLKEFGLTAAEAAGKTKKELRDLEDSFYKSEENIGRRDPFGKEILSPKGLIAQAAKDAEDAGNAYIRAFSNILVKLGRPYDEIRIFELNFFNDSISGYDKYSKNLSESQKKQIEILRKNYADKQEAFQAINQKYNLIVANRALADKKEAEDLANKTTRQKSYNDLIAELLRDIEKVRTSPILTIDEKNTKILETIKTGLLTISDLKPIEFKADKGGFIKGFTELFNIEKIKQFKLSIRKEFSNLSDELKGIDITSQILNVSGLPEKINLVENLLKSKVADFGKLFLFPITGAGSAKQFNSSLIELIFTTATLKSKLEELKELKIDVDIDSLISKFNKANRKIESNYNATLETLSTSRSFVKPLEENLKKDENLLGNAMQTLGESIALRFNPFDPRNLKLAANIKNLKKEIQKDLKDIEIAKLADQLNSEIDAAFTEAAQGTLEGIGNILGGENVGDVFGGIFGNLMQSLGKSLIKFALLSEKAKAVIEGLKKTLFGPGGTVAIGAALALGVALIAGGKLLAKAGNKGFAKGGYVSGDGDGTSDSIPARLSNGEYVVKANSVSRYGVGFLNAINNGTFKRFADGGLVSNLNIPGIGSMRISGMANKNINTAGMGSMVVGETVIKGQDLRLILSRSDNRFNSSTSNAATSKSFII